MNRNFVLFIVLFFPVNFVFSNTQSENSKKQSFKPLIDSVEYWYNIDELPDYTLRESIPIFSFLKKGIFLYKKGKVTEAVSVLKNIISKPEADEEIKTICFWTLGKICSDSPTYGDYTSYYLMADSIVQMHFSPNNQLLFYEHLIKDHNVVTIQTIPLPLIDNAIKVLEKNENWQKMASYMHLKISYYRHIGNYYQVLKWYNETLAICRKHNMEAYEGNVLLWAIEIYSYSEDTSRILRDIKKAVYINNKYNDSILIARSQNVLGRYYGLNKNYSQAIVHYHKAAEINNKLNLENRLGINYLNLGVSYLNLNKFEESEKYYFKSIELNNKVGFDIGNGFVYDGLIKLNIKKKRLKKALDYISIAKYYAVKCDYHKVKIDVYTTLIDYYLKTSNKDSCIKYLSIVSELKDSIDSKEIHSRMQMYETNLKEQEIAILQNEKNLLNAKQEKLIGISLIVIVAIIGLLIIMSLYFIKEKTHSKLVEKNMQLINATENSYDSNLNQESKHEELLLAQQFMSLLKQEKHYQKPNISVDYFVELLNTNRMYLSKAINKTFKKNFSLLINEFRIQKACKMLLDDNYNNFSIEGIAVTVGFNSKTSFNRVFKIQTGLTPSDFRKNQMGNA